MSGKQKLELTWIGKDVRSRLEPRVLIAVPEKSYCADSASEHSATNSLIFGDNLLALKALEADYKGRIKCIFIDPPYNTGSAFTHYEDGVEHSLWLSLVRERIEIIKRLVAEDGSVWITIDDNEAHYLKVLCDEVFGRSNFIVNALWQKRTSPDGRIHMGDAHDHILVYGSQTARNNFNLLPLNDDQKKSYKNPDNDPKGPWVSTDFTAQGYRPNQMYEIVTPGGARYSPPEGRCWGNIEDNYRRFLSEGRMWFGKDGNARPRIKNYLSEAKGVRSWSWWKNDEVGHNQEAKKEINALFGAENAFDTPKPERLIRRVLEIATNPGDLVLDSFAGSGTTGAVAHKMGRRWIMIELGEHCHTHIIPRMKKVIDGEDPGGITEAVGWKGGGGFRYYKLGPSLITQDQWGREIIAPEYRQNTAMLIEAMCKLHGYTFKPSDTHFWMHGQSTETDYIYVTTESLSKDQVEFIANEVGDERSLLICCGSHRLKDPAQFANITVTKIPKSVLEKCEWGKDDYSLKIRNLPLAEDVPEAIPEAEQEDAKAEKPKRKRGRPRKARAEDPNQTTLF